MNERFQERKKNKEKYDDRVRFGQRELQTFIIHEIKIVSRALKRPDKRKQ